MSSAVFRRHVRFEKGYNYLHETGPSRRGQHGMGIRFVLAGPDGAAQFLMNTMWTPLGEVDRTAMHNEACHIDHSNGRYDNLVRAPYASDLGYHWRRPLYEGALSMGPCRWLGGAECFYDGSGLMAEPVLRAFITHGEQAIWAQLVQRYRWCLEGEAEATS